MQESNATLTERESNLYLDINYNCNDENNARNFVNIFKQTFHSIIKFIIFCTLNM